MKYGGSYDDWFQFKVWCARLGRDSKYSRRIFCFGAHETFRNSAERCHFFVWSQIGGSQCLISFFVSRAVVVLFGVAAKCRMNTFCRLAFRWLFVASFPKGALPRINAPCFLSSNTNYLVLNTSCDKCNWVAYRYIDNYQYVYESHQVLYDAKCFVYELLHTKYLVLSTGMGPISFPERVWTSRSNIKTYLQFKFL